MFELRFALAVLAAPLVGACTVGTISGDNQQDASSEAGICTPSAKRCDGDSALMCAAGGASWLTVTCPYGCSDGRCNDCVPDCSNRACGDNGCGDSCGTCAGAQELCVAGTCACQPDCLAYTCGGDGCGGSCGQCGSGMECSPEQSCVPILCETAVCGVCDEIDTSQVIMLINSTGEQATQGLSVFDWPITTELHIDNSIYNVGWSFTHFPGQFWNATTPTATQPAFPDGAAMVACWDSITYGGVVCQVWEFMVPGLYNDNRLFEWPVGRPIAHFFTSAIDYKRTAIRYYATWPWPVSNDPNFNLNTVGPNMLLRTCQ